MPEVNKKILDWYTEYVPIELTVFVYSEHLFAVCSRMSLAIQLAVLKNL